MKSVFAALTILMLCSTASAQVTSIPQFTGTDTETFEGPQVLFLPCIPQRIFGNKGDMCAGQCHTTTSWGYVCQINTHGGSWLFASASGPAIVTFDTQAYRFGGWFGTNCGIPDATFEFSDAAGNVLATLPASVPADCQWHWLGWTVGSGTPIKSVKVIGNISGGSYIMMDDLQADLTPVIVPPTAYCTAGTTSNGCVASISANANPNVAHSTACQVTVSNVEGQRAGIVYYGLAQTVSPWCSQGGGTSTLCVKAPVKRTGVQQTGGTLGLCDGTLSRDWNAFQLANPTALGAPWAAGANFYLQGWFRDPLACKTTNLSNALKMTYVP